MKNAGLLLVFIQFVLCNGFAQQAKPATILWSKGRALAIADFTIIANNDYSIIKGNNLAITRTGITYSIKAPRSHRGTIEIHVYATMYPSNSYLREKVLNDTPENRNYLLQHEQKHFDISEIYAREAVKCLKGLTLTERFNTEISDLMKNIFKEAEAFQDLYDKETNNGRSAPMQKQWDQKIAERLMELKGFEGIDMFKTLS